MGNRRSITTDGRPLVSVYIPTKNRLRLLMRAVESVLAQTYPYVELIVADDGSTDGTRDYLSALEDDGRLRWIAMPSSMGACVARNFAIAASTGELVTGLDDDDFFLPPRIEDLVEKWLRQVASGARNAGVFNPSRLLLQHGEEILFTGERETASDLKTQNRVGTHVLAPKAHFIGAGLFDPAMPCWQDWDMWQRMAALYGDFIGGGVPSYVWDMSAPGGHTTNKPEFMIRHGYRLFSEKAGLRSARDRAGPLGTLSLYPQVRLSVGELVTLVVNGHGKAALAYSLRKVLGEGRFSRLRLSMKK